MGALIAAKKRSGQRVVRPCRFEITATRDCHVPLCRLRAKLADFADRSGQDKVARLGAIAPIRTVEVGHE
jgi:hypothetical protein